MSDYRYLTRRDFVRDGALGALALGVGAPVPRGAFAEAAGEAKSVVTLVRDEKVLDEAHKADPAVVKKMLDEVIKSVTGESSAAVGWKKLVKPDDVVGLVPTKAVNPTHEEVTKAVEAAVAEAGVAADRILSVQGKKDLVAKCTVLISLPALKTHWLTGLGTVMKNYITFGDKKASEFHQDKNGEMGSIWLLPAVKGKTRIVIVDALQPLFERGPKPDPKYLWHYNGLMAGTDPVAVETMALAILMAKRKAFKGEPWELTPPPLCVAAADKEYHLGTNDPSKIALKVSGWEKDLLVSA